MKTKLATTLFVFSLALLLALPSSGRIRSYFTSVEKAGMDDILIEVMRKAEVRAKAGREASIDVLVFSFTTKSLADELLRIAATYPDLVQIRVMLDVTQMSQGQSHKGPYMHYASIGDYWKACDINCKDEECMSPCMDELQSIGHGVELENFKVRYWFYNAWVWSSSKNMPSYHHSKGKLMHHKAVLVNRQILASGSYNWSVTAAKKNYENFQVFSGTREQGVVQDFLAEFEAIWNHPENSVNTQEGQARKSDIWDALYEENCPECQ